jgi:hypothetical protein
MKLPSKLQSFIDNDGVKFHCDDGDWDLNIAPREKSDFKKELPKGALMIAENGSGDCLFLKAHPKGKLGNKVFVYWHEEERSETFAPDIGALIKTSAETKADEPANDSARKGISFAGLKNRLAKLKPDSFEIAEVLREYKEGDVAIESLPLLQKFLIADDASNAIEAAECIAKLGPAAKAQAEKEGDANLEFQLWVIGSKVWEYSLAANCYSACLEALLKIEADEEFILDYICRNIGMDDSDDLVAAMQGLQRLGTKEARDLAKRAAAFWAPELNPRTRKEIDKVLKSFR